MTYLAQFSCLGSRNGFDEVTTILGYEEPLTALAPLHQAINQAFQGELPSDANCCIQGYEGLERDTDGDTQWQASQA